MSRLDSAIRRLQAQRASLDLALGLIRQLEGPMFELGLGNGRTYDHLREHGEGREIFVFERQVAAHPDCIPDDDHLFLGDVLENLPKAVERFGGRVALLHADIGTGEAARNAELAAAIASFLPRLLAPGGIAVTDQPMQFEGAETLALPDGVAAGRINLYRKPA